MDCDDLDVGEHVRGDAIFLCIPASVLFCPFSGFGLEHTLWISLLVVSFLFPLWHSICCSVFRFSF